MDYLEMMRRDADSALAILKSVERQIMEGNFFAAMNSIGSVNINLASAESNRRIYKLSSEIKNKGATNG